MYFAAHFRLICKFLPTLYGKHSFRLVPIYRIDKKIFLARFLISDAVYIGENRFGICLYNGTSPMKKQKKNWLFHSSIFFYYLYFLLSSLTSALFSTCESESSRSTYSWHTKDRSIFGRCMVCMEITPFSWIWMIHRFKGFCALAYFWGINCSSAFHIFDSFFFVFINLYQ